MHQEYTFTFGNSASCVSIQNEIPSIKTIAASCSGILLICDTHTAPIAHQIRDNQDLPLCMLEPGEAAKTWGSVEAILRAARDAGLGRDGLLVGIGGGVISDMTAFAGSIYMRGIRVCLVSTTLLGMVDAALGGKTGFDLFDIKNLVGTFYPAQRIYMPLASLAHLPGKEWKSGMAELIKTAVLDSADHQGTFLSLLKSLNTIINTDFETAVPHILQHNAEQIFACIARSVQIKGRIVEADPKETGKERVMLNLGHTFGHALESAAGLGQVSHGEAVAWGMVRSTELGRALGITPQTRAEEIIGLIRAFGYETAAPHPLMNSHVFMQALGKDKKKKGGKLVFVVPATVGTTLVSGEQVDPRVLEHIIGGT